MNDTAPRRPSPIASTIAPLPAEGLFNPGTEFPPDDLRHRVLSVFWLNCCHPPFFSRAPAPVLELSPEEFVVSGPRRRLAAWWLVANGILVDTNGPYSPRLESFFGRSGQSGHLWPKYEFSVMSAAASGVTGAAVVVELAIYAEPLVRWKRRIKHTYRESGLLRVEENSHSLDR